MELPFDNYADGYTMYTTYVPGVGHPSPGPTMEDIDYAPTLQNAWVTAPADGVVRAVSPGQYGGYGKVVRINHGGVDSFFAHLRENVPGQPLNILVSDGQQVSQGQRIARIGDTGSPGQFHLHFGARVGWTANVYDSGTPVPILALPGNWFGGCYTPPPNAQSSCGLFTGIASSQQTIDVPQNAPGWVRHLSNMRSPLQPPSFYASKVNASSVGLSMGANKGLSFDNTYFQIQKYNISCPCWQVESNNVWSGITLSAFEPVEKRVLFSLADTGNSGWASANVSYENGASRKNHLATYTSTNESFGALEFRLANHTWYQVNDAVSGVFYLDLQRTSEPAITVLTMGSK